MKPLITVILLLVSSLAIAQPKNGQARLDSLLAELPNLKEDSFGVILMDDISFAYLRVNPQEGISWGKKELALAQKIGWKKGERMAYNQQGNNYMNKGEQPAALEAFFKALHIEESNPNGDASGILNNIGNVYDKQRNYNEAIEYFKKALKVAEKNGNKKCVQSALGNMGSTYSSLKENEKALEYQMRSLAIAEELNATNSIIIQTGNIGASYAGMKDYNRSIAYYHKAYKLAKETGAKQTVAVNLGNLGVNYLTVAGKDVVFEPDSLISADKKKNIERSIAYLEEAIAICEKEHFISYIPKYKNSLAKAYAEQGDFEQALSILRASTELKDSLYSDETIKKLTRAEEGYRFQRKEDSIRLENEKRELAMQKEMQLSALKFEYEKKQAAAKTEKEREQLRFEEELKRQKIEAEFQQKQAIAQATYDRRAAEARQQELISKAEIKRQKNLMTAAVAVGGLLLIIAVIALRAYRQKKKSEAVIAKEKERSEELLLNILPAEVAEELKDTGASTAKHYDQVTVLFTDFVGFTTVAEKMTPQELVQELHECFSAFDEISVRHGLEKIKTIGDAYMAVCGLPHQNPFHARNTVLAALEMVEFVKRRNENGGHFHVRIGMNSGVVVAGIVGIKKFAYDIWGDTVNVAARMEQSGQPGKVNISRSTYELVKDEFRCDYRGELPAKNKGNIEMYFVESSVAEPV